MQCTPTVLKIRRSRGHLIFSMGIPVLVRHLIETAPTTFLVKEIHVIGLQGAEPGEDSEKPSNGGLNDAGCGRDTEINVAMTA